MVLSYPDANVDGCPGFFVFFSIFLLVLILKKFDCLGERADIPDRSNKTTREDLEKVTDYVTLKFDCPRIVINGKYKLIAL